MEEKQFEIKLTKTEAKDKCESLIKEIRTMEWDIEHHGLMLKQGLYDKKKAELEAIQNFLDL